jgi:hypothetical protein
MKVAWIEWSGAAAAAALALFVSVTTQAAEPASGITAVAAEELDKRSKEAEEAQTQSKGLSDSSVRVLMTYSFSLIPNQVLGPDGKPTKVDKSDPNKFLIPGDDARRVIRAATRSAYAQVCNLPKLAEANYETMINGEKAKKTWTNEQLLMIEALHLFSVSYFTGNAKISSAGGGGAAAGDKTTVPKSGEGTAETAQVVAPPAPKCPPEQKQKVTNAINAYVRAAQAQH